MLGDSKELGARPLAAIPDFVTSSRHSLLYLLYRGRLGFPWTRVQRLLKTKDIAVRDRLIGVVPTAPWQGFSYW